MISPYSFTLPGGVQIQALYLAEALRRRGWDVSLLGPCDGPPPDPGIIPLGDSLFIAANGSMAPIAFDPSAWLRSYAALREHCFDVIHVHEPLVPAPSIAALVAKPAPLLGTFHASGGSFAYEQFPGLLRRLCDRLDWRTAVSAKAQNHARSHLGGSYELLFNGVPLDRFQEVEPYPTCAPTIFFVGRHEPRKGLRVLLEAAKRLPEEVVFWVAGEGSQTSELRQNLGDNQRVQWLGRISETEKIARLRAADVFCAPSLRGESFGVVLIEAMASGTAIVASDITGYARVARPDVEAVLVPPGNPEELAKGLLKVLEAPEELVRRGAARARQFSMDSLAARYEAIYERLLN